MKTYVALILVSVLLLPLISMVNMPFPLDHIEGLSILISLVRRPYTVGLIVVGGRLELNGEPLYGTVHIHFGNQSCSFTVDRVLGRLVSCNLVEGVRYWRQLLEELGVAYGSARDIINTLRLRGISSIAGPTLTIRFVLYDSEGNMYVAVFALAPVNYYMALGYDPKVVFMRALERPLEFIEKGLVIVLGRDYLASRLIKMPRLTEIVPIFQIMVEDSEIDGSRRLETHSNMQSSKENELLFSGQSHCEFLDEYIYSSTPDPWLTRKIQVNIHDNTLTREWVYERLWMAYLNLFGRLIRCPGSWSQEYVFRRITSAYYQMLGMLNLNDFISADRLVLGLMRYDGWLLDYARQGRVSITWNHSLPRNSVIHTYKPYMIFLYQNTSIYSIDSAGIKLYLTRVKVDLAYKKSGIALLGVLFQTQQLQSFDNIESASIDISSMMVHNFNYSAVALLIPARYQYLGDAFYLRLDLWQQSGYWYALVTPIPLPWLREVEEYSSAYWRIVYYDKLWRPSQCLIWNGTPANDCPRLDALSMLNSVSSFTNITFHTAYSSHYLNVPPHLLLIDTSRNSSLSSADSLASVAFSIFSTVGSTFAAGLSPNHSMILSLAQLVSYVDTTLSGSGVIYDLYISRLTSSANKSPIIRVDKMTFGYSQGLARPLLGAYFVYVGELPEGGDCDEIACQVSFIPSID